MWEKLISFWKSDNLLEQAWQQSYEMIQLSHEMFAEAVRVLNTERDIKIRDDIRRTDKQINKFEREVRRKVLTHCSLRAPSGLAEGMVLVSIVIDIERLGDYTKNIVDLAVQHPEPLQPGSYRDDMGIIEKETDENFKRTKECLQTSDQDLALELLERFRNVNDMCDRNLEYLVRGRDQSLNISDSAALALYFRWLKRINSHLRNITSSVVNPFDRIGFKPKKKDL